jgi:Flp pilus assembly pilin Flp
MFTKIKKFIKDEGGMGVVEVILIIVVLISLVLIFKNQLTSIVKSLFSKISGSAAQF